MGQKLSTGVALLRGINLGSKNRISMPHLEQMFVEIGCTGVCSYIQSGNVIFRASAAQTAKVASRISAMLAKKELRVPVVVRSAPEMQAVIENNPFLKAGESEDLLHVMFLADVPEQGRVTALDPNRSAPDRFVVLGRDVYLHLPNGVADTKLTNAWFDSKLATVSTGRNWRTVLKLCEMMKE